MALKPPSRFGGDTRGESELTTESSMHARDHAMESDDDGDEHPFHGFRKKFLEGDPKSARDAFRGMLSTVEDDTSSADAPSLLEAFRGRDK